MHTLLFWIFQVGLGGIVPMVLLFHPRLGRTPAGLAGAAALVIQGGLAQIYVIIIGGQSWPLLLFPGMDVSSSFFDGVRHSYAPSLPEVALGIGGAAAAGLIVMLGLRLLAILPASLADRDIDPHYRGAAEAGRLGTVA